jgi:hypothetical protein
MTLRPAALGLVFLATAGMFAPLASDAKTKNAAANLPATEEIVDMPLAQSRQRVVSLTFKQIGAWSSLKLRGVDGSQTLAFTIRSDEVVVGAKLRIAYDYSPALLPDLSHLRVLLNERVVAVEGLPHGKSVGNAREINLDPRLFNEFNELRFNLIGHYTRQCEDPFHSSLWLTLSDLGRLELTLAPLSTTNDLKQLPAPFLDTRDNSALRLPFVFVGTPSLGTARAAGVVASWFGIQAGARGAQFPATLSGLPAGNAVLFLQGNDSLAGLRATPGATLSIHPHPANPQAKLLLVSGGGEEELMRAARALALIAPTLAGHSVSITKETEAAPRKPYDAPAWVPVDRPVRFGELARATELRTQGYYPGVIRVNFRVPPDVFAWRTPGAPLDLKYRATDLPEHKNSALAVSLNASLVDNLALNAPRKAAAELESLLPVRNANPSVRKAALHLPPYEIGGRNQLQFAYSFDVLKEGECKNIPPDNLQGAIDADSTVDFSQFPKYAVLPNLAYFASLGYPFTRMADLTETAVVLPERPNAEELSLYMALMGRMGESTGYPSIHHMVVAPGDVEKFGSRDFIVIGSANNQALMTKWAERLPVVQVNGERRIRAPQKSWMPAYRWDLQDEDAKPSAKGSLSLVNNGNLAVMMGFESPLQDTRSVVFLYADRPQDLRKLSDALTGAELSGQIQGDVAIIDDKNISHARVGHTYSVGFLPWLNKVKWFLSDHPLLSAFIALLASVLLAAISYRTLRRLSSKRSKKILLP